MIIVRIIMIIMIIAVTIIMIPHKSYSAKAARKQQGTKSCDEHVGRGGDKRSAPAVSRTSYRGVRHLRRPHGTRLHLHGHLSFLHQPGGWRAAGGRTTEGGICLTAGPVLVRFRPCSMQGAVCALLPSGFFVVPNTKNIAHVFALGEVAIHATGHPRPLMAPGGSGPWVCAGPPPARMFLFRALSTSMLGGGDVSPE